MATFYSSQFTKAYVNKPSEKIPPGEISGEVKVAIATITIAGAQLTTADTVKMMKLPANSRIIDAKLFAPSLGTTGIMIVGNSTDPDCLIANADFGGQAAIATPVVGGSALGYEYESEVELIMTPTENTQDGIGKTISLVVSYANY